METNKVGLTSEDLRWGHHIFIVGYSKVICESRKLYDSNVKALRNHIRMLVYIHPKH